MPQANVFDGAFDAATLDTEINAVPYVPTSIGARGLFKDDPLDTTEVYIEVTDLGITVLPVTPRGSPGNVNTRTGRHVVKLTLPRIQVRDALLADSWQNRRGFGEASSLATIERERNRVLESMRGKVETTIEWHSARALAGQVINPDASVVVDLLSEFGVVQNTHNMVLGTTTTNVANQLVAAKRKSEAEVGAAQPKSWVAFCSASFIDAVRAHPSVETFLAGWSAATALRDDVRDSFPVAGVTLVEVRNAAGVTFIEDGAAYLCPEGIPGLFMRYFGPADYTDTVNREALPLYARAFAMPFDRGWHLEAQANALSVCRRPRAVVKLLA